MREFPNSPGRIWILLAIAPLVVGFDLSTSQVPQEDILSGGPPKDGIPAIDDPRFVPAEDADFLRDDDRVVGVVVDGAPRAYPVRILDWHEVVNDAAGGDPFAVTWCPLTGTGVVFDRKVAGETVSFGVSGRLYQSNVLLYDRETESLWSQLGGGAVTGERAGIPLRERASVTTSWARWRERHPETLVLSAKTGHRRPYGETAYADYRGSPNVMFPVSPIDRRLPAKTEVVGVEIEGEALAFPLDRLPDEPATIPFRLGGKAWKLEWAPDGPEALVTTGGGELAASVRGYWFGWAAFHPDTAIWSPDETGAGDGAPASGDAVDADTVALKEHRGEWTSLLSLSAEGTSIDDDSGTLFVISGEVENRGDVPIRHVRFVFELLDESGRVVARETGFNRRAEDLRPATDARGREISDDSPSDVEPLRPGETDTFRMLFLREETPPFADYAIRVGASR